MLDSLEDKLFSGQAIGSGQKSQITCVVGVKWQPSF